ncbi:ATPase [Streptomyces kaniharaensis]|uniref:ATPase n=1 Tax=Streptomyces kaniharaensis TaxID=212423 RepID=A0A6N7L6U7_9ACTN|nr:RNase adapter RapZ [Streptomyces kaniharaensis]MQS17953.1 ATPase [Streptomyces kaniharaensis]
MQSMRIEITSFGFGHGPVPEAEMVLDLRKHFRDPHKRTGFRKLTARDQEVRDVVAATPGILQVVAAAVTMAQSYAMGPEADTNPFRIAVGCVGGRHRAPATAEMLENALVAAQFHVSLTHRDLDREVLESGRDADRTQAYAEVIERALDSLLDELDDEDELDVSVAAENAAGALVHAGY